MRCNFNGSQHETIIRTGDWKTRNIEMPKGEAATNRSDIEMLSSSLPKPINLEVSEDSQTLFWTDRGDPPMGNCLNSVKLDGLKTLKGGVKNPNYEILTRQLHEAYWVEVGLDQ
jgi:hypothetical protein